MAGGVWKSVEYYKAIFAAVEYVILLIIFIGRFITQYAFVVLVLHKYVLHAPGRPYSLHPANTS